jgi:Cft2 family RNA processing exonuclease
MEVSFTPEGIYLPALDLWLDPEGDRPTAFISHGHADHATGRHGVAICTPVTAEIHRLRNGQETGQKAVPFRETFEHRGARLTLYPAGHILGAAQLLVELGGERLVYTGDLKLDPALCADAAEIVPCDHLIIESTFGLPMFRFLSADETRRRIVATARALLNAGEIPVFLGYPLGRGQEIVEVLRTADVPVAAHGAVARYLDVYARHTGREFDAEPYERDAIEGHAIVGPSSFGRQISRSVKKSRVIAVSGWALLDSARARYGADVLISYSDHASFPELMKYVEGCGTRKVDVVHGFTEAFAEILRQKGFEARAPTAAAEVADRDEATL